MDFEIVEQLSNLDIEEIYVDILQNSENIYNAAWYGSCGIGTSQVYGAGCWIYCGSSAYRSANCASGYVCDVGRVYSNCRITSCINTTIGGSSSSYGCTTIGKTNDFTGG